MVSSYRSQRALSEYNNYIKQFCSYNAFSKEISWGREWGRG